MKSKKIFWGIFFILAAIYVIVSKLGMLPDIGVFKILLTVCMIALIIEGIRYINFYQILLPLAFIGILYDTELGITALTPWTLLAAALFLSIGLSMIFRGRKKNYGNMNWEGNHGMAGNETVYCNGQEIRCENNFGAAIRYINSDNFKSAKIENNFGTLTVYFDNAIVQTGTASVLIENNFGETNLYIPKEWRVENNLDRAFGSVQEKGRREETGTTTLYLNGNAAFGAIIIYYI